MYLFVIRIIFANIALESIASIHFINIIYMILRSTIDIITGTITDVSFSPNFSPTCSFSNASVTWCSFDQGSFELSDFGVRKILIAQIHQKQLKYDLISFLQLPIVYTLVNSWYDQIQMMYWILLMHNNIDFLSSLVSIKSKMFNLGAKQLKQASFKIENACTVFWKLQTVHKLCQSLIWHLVHDDFIYKNRDFLSVLVSVKFASSANDPCFWCFKHFVHF